MARTVPDCRLDSRTARHRLKPSPAPYWRKLSRGQYLGYRRNQLDGSWIARRRDRSGRQHHQRLGSADDVLDADGNSTLNFEQAQQKARQWFEASAAIEVCGRVRGTYTVGDCLDDYLSWAEQHRKSAAHMKVYIRAFIKPHLGQINTADISSAQLRAWQSKLVEEPPRLRSGVGRTLKYRCEHPNSDEALRRRRLRANRMLTLLRAALNRAWRDGLIATHRDEWMRVELYKGVERQRDKFLMPTQAQALILACDTDLRKLVQLALVTGARYGELCGIRVRDFDQQGGTIHIRQSKNGKPRRIVLNEEGVGLCSEFAKGLSANALLLQKTDGTSWLRDHQFRPFKKAIKAAELDPSFTFHELRHTWASLAIMNGVPLIVVAKNLGHSDTRMVERHYGHLCPTFLTEQIREKAPRFGFLWPTCA